MHAINGALKGRSLASLKGAVMDNQEEIRQKAEEELDALYEFFGDLTDTHDRRFVRKEIISFIIAGIKLIEPTFSAMEEVGYFLIKKYWEEDKKELKPVMSFVNNQLALASLDDDKFIDFGKRCLMCLLYWGDDYSEGHALTDFNETILLRDVPLDRLIDLIHQYKKGYLMNNTTLKLIVFTAFLRNIPRNTKPWLMIAPQIK